MLRKKRDKNTELFTQDLVKSNIRVEIQEFSIVLFSVEDISKRVKTPDSNPGINFKEKALSFFREDPNNRNRDFTNYILSIELTGTWKFTKFKYIKNIF